MGAKAFDLPAYCARIGAAPKERNAVRQDLVRGLKDYYARAYGYDRYGAETVFRLAERMSEPYLHGFGTRRILHDRRISTATKVGAAQYALDLIEYGADGGLPYGLYGAGRFLLAQDCLTTFGLRYLLVSSAGEFQPFSGLEKEEAIDFFKRLLRRDELPAVERLFWGHSLIARHQDQPGAHDLIALLLGSEDIPRVDRIEVCRAWINFRQPRLMVDIPDPDENEQSIFVSQHMPFWVAHAPSWPTPAMVRDGLVWLVRLGEDPLQVARRYLVHQETFADQIHGAVAQILEERHEDIPSENLRALIEAGISMPGSVPTRRRFYRLGNDLFGSEYLARASDDSASSVRQWAARQLQRSP